MQRRARIIVHLHALGANAQLSAATTAAAAEIAKEAGRGSARWAWLQDTLEGLAGTGGGLLGLAVVFPLERISALMQTDTSASSDTATERLLHILRTEGFAGLYQGFSSGLVAMLVTMYIFFTAHSISKRLTLRALGIDRLGPLADLFAASAAGAGTAVLSNPVWLINTRLMLHNKRGGSDTREHGGKMHPNGGPGHGGTIAGCAAQLYAEGGWRSFFRGVGPALGTVAGTGLQFMAYEQCKKLILAPSRSYNGLGDLKRTQPSRDISGAQAFFIGALSKMFSTAVTYPLQTIARRMQQQPKAGESNTAKHYNSTLHCARMIIRSEGVLALYKGLKPRLLQMVLQNAIKLYGFEVLLTLLKMQTLKQTTVVAGSSAALKRA